MTRKKAAAAEPETIDVSVPVRLFYAGGPVYGDAPARDLSLADIEYLWRVAALRASGGQPVDPATSDDIEAFAAELEATGAFSSDAPPAPADPAEETPA